MAIQVVKEPPPSLTALGRRSLPHEIAIGEFRYAQKRVFKNDFFAATAMYEGPDGKVVLKVARQASFLGLPLEWVGRILAARERDALNRLQDLEGIPQLIGTWGRTGIVREYVEGNPLGEGDPAPDDFFPRLRCLIEKMHGRGMAYVDLEKPQNVLVGDDGGPCLFDFQISWNLPARWGGELWAARVLRRWFQEGDGYHLLKLQRRMRPDQLSEAQIVASYRKPWYLRAHGVMTRPLTLLRRRILNRVDPRRKSGERGRVTEEDMIGAA